MTTIYDCRGLILQMMVSEALKRNEAVESKYCPRMLVKQLCVENTTMLSRAEKILH